MIKSHRYYAKSSASDNYYIGPRNYGGFYVNPREFHHTNFIHNKDMDQDELLDTCDSHPRTIIHIDIDCFYAQVEEIRNPLLRTKPLGIQQKNIIVTCNYIARQYGIHKLMLLSEAKKLCPQLTLVNGEDLTNYRKMSARIFDILLMFTPFVEKLGMDEN